MLGMHAVLDEAANQIDHILQPSRSGGGGK